MLLLHAGATAAMVGLIWTVQLVIYPLLRSTEPPMFVAIHRLHTTRISVVLALFAPVEALSAVLLVSSRPDSVSDTLLWGGLALLAIAWGLTLLLSAPAHASLRAGYDLDAINRLIRSNWLRTATWTARGVVALTMISRVIG